MTAELKFTRLWSPIRIGKVEVRNRIVLTGHGTGMGRDSKPDERQIAYYAERAKGGVGLMMIGSQQVHPTSPGITNLLCNYDDGIIPGLRAIADVAHAHGAKAFGFVSHMGLASSARPDSLWSASAIYDQKYGEVAHAMTVSEMAILVRAFADAAARNIEAGMDGIQVHGGHGLLMNQFLSPHTNRRADDYGGSVENRLRFPVQVIRAVRERVGPDVPLGMRLSGDELLEDGLEVEDMTEIVPLLVEAASLDYVDVSVGNDGDIVSNMLHEPPMGLNFAPFAHLAKRIREVAGVPIIHGTRVRDANVGERILAEGAADLVGMCRPLIADPYLPNKAKAGLLKETTPCVGCEQACLGRLHRGRHISCVGNPVTGHERDWAALPKVDRPRKVVVVGGGPSGMQAALVAAERGHNVILFERSERLGGLLNLAAKVPGREEWGDLVANKAYRLAREGVELRLNTETTAEGVLAEGADAVILATGTTTSRPGLAGENLPHVMTVRELIVGASVGRRVLVVDYLNRQPGITSAIMLASSGHDVSIVTEGMFVGHKLEQQNYAYFYMRLFDPGVTLLPHIRVRSFGETHVTVSNMYTRAEGTLGPFDTIVLATPGHADRELEFALAERATTQSIGDCYAPRDVEAAVLEGHMAGASV